MTDLPPLPSVAAACVFLGVMFALRYLLALRRIGQEAPVRWRSALRPPPRGAFGDAIELNRRYAARQYWQAAAFVVGGLLLFCWLAATGRPFGPDMGA